MVFGKGTPKTTEEVRKAIALGLSCNNQSKGYCYKKNGESTIHIKKGFLKETPGEVAQHIIDLNLGEDDELIVHGRIPTDGPRDESMAHPFVCSPDHKVACMVEGETNLPVLAHNGVFSNLLSSRDGAYSDTAAFAIKIASNPVVLEFIKRNPTRAVKMFVDKKIWGWSKVAMMFPDRGIVILGEDWKTENTEKLKGMFSNGGYKDYVYDRGGSSSNRSCSVGGSFPQLPPSTATTSSRPTKIITGSAYENVWRTSNSREGSFDIKEIIFRNGFASFAINYSNHRIIPNVLNYIFIEGILNRHYLHDPLVPSCLRAHANQRFIINSLSKNGEVALISFPQASNIVHPIRYRKLIKYCEFDSIMSYDFALDWDKDTNSSLEGRKDFVNFELFDAVNDYNYLCSASQINGDGTISNSYFKKLTKILSNATIQRFFFTKDLDRAGLTNAHSRTKPIINSSISEITPMWTFNSLKHTGKLTTNKGIVLKNMSYLAILWFVTERGHDNVDNNDYQTRNIIASLARKFNLIYSHSLPIFTSNDYEVTLMAKEFSNSDENDLEIDTIGPKRGFYPSDRSDIHNLN
jgi:hypothetical protein